MNCLSFSAIDSHATRSGYALGNGWWQQITLTPFWPGRIIKSRDALSPKAIAVFYFDDENAALTFLTQSSHL
jgi:hypothetical protein